MWANNPNAGCGSSNMTVESDRVISCGYRAFGQKSLFPSPAAHLIVGNHNMDTIRAFTRFKTEGLTVGRLLAAYADLEFSLFHCVNAVRDDFDTVFKVMFKARGEKARIDMADTLGRQKYRKIKLGTKFEMAISSLRYCLKIRNQYAHCLWYDDNSGNMAFTNLEEIADGNAPITTSNLKSLTIHHVDNATLSDQEAYFEYTDNLLMWLNNEGLRLAEKATTPRKPAPKQLRRPPPHMQ